MQFNRLEVGETRNMCDAEAALHQIDASGDSELPEYADSIFSYARCDISTRSLKGGEVKTAAGYSVTRMLKKDVLELPLNTPVVLSLVKVMALQIDVTGISKRADLSGYKFTYKLLEGGTQYEITKKLKI